MQRDKDTVSTKALTGRSFGSIILRIRSFAAKLFDSSVAIAGIARLRKMFLQLRMRMVGIFFLTFGAYTSLIALFVKFFTVGTIDAIGLYTGISLMIAAAPLLLSRGNISTALLGSNFGGTLCEYLGLRRESLREYDLLGRPNIAFVLGVLAGTLSLWIPPLKIILHLFLATIACIILAMPENGILLSALLLPFGSDRLQEWILALTACSYLLKLLRGKRSLQLQIPDIFAGVMLLAVFGGGLFTASGIAFSETLRYVLLMAAYFASALILQDHRKISRIVAAAYISGGVLAALYTAGFVLAAFFPHSFAKDPGFLLQLVSTFPVCASGAITVLLLAMLPLAAGGALRVSPGRTSRLTAVLCFISMAVCLVFCGSTMEVLLALIEVVLLLIMLGKRSGFLSLAAILTVVVVLLHTGFFKDVLDQSFAALIRTVVAELRQFTEAVAALSPIEFIAGQGFGVNVAMNAAGENNFYWNLIISVGMIGFLIFAAFVVVLIGMNLRFFARTQIRRCSPEAELRFGIIRSSSDMRLGSGAPLCSAGCLLMLGMFAPIWQDGTVFALFWLMCGLSIAYMKSASREIEKADQSDLASFNPEYAAIDFSRKKED